jgi:hypothetical protein
MKAGLEVTWMPYGPNARRHLQLHGRALGPAGGLAGTNRPHGAIVLNLRSISKFEPLVRPGGIRSSTPA